MPICGERLAARDPQLRADEVDAGDLLGHGVLDLDARVHLHERERAVGADEELHRAGVDVADRAGERERRLVQPGAGRLGQVGRRRELDDLLVPPLHRAVALEQVHHRRRACRRAPAPRCGAAARPPARGRSSRRRRPRPPRGEADSAASASSSGVRTRRSPRPPPPAAALTNSGKPTSSAASSAP